MCAQFVYNVRTKVDAPIFIYGEFRQLNAFRSRAQQTPPPCERTLVHTRARKAISARELYKLEVAKS